MRGLCAHSSSFFGGAVAVALVVGVLALAGVIDDDPRLHDHRPRRRRRPPRPPSRDESAVRRAGESISDIYKRVSTGVVFIQAGQSATGSGFVYDNEGHIVTNDHVVEGANSFQVRIGADTKPIPARLVGKDPSLGPRGPEGRPGRGQGRPEAARAR